MCLLCGGCLSKMVLKNVRWEKNKKHWVGLSVGSNVLLKYGLYVVCHLSKWFTFSSLFNGHFLLCRVVIRLQLTCLYAILYSAYTTNCRVYMRYCVAFIYVNINNFLCYFPFITSAKASYFALLMANSFSSCAIRRSLLSSMLTLLV